MNTTYTKWQSYVYACVFLAQKIHISENAKEALDEIGSYHIVFRDSMAVKVSICLNTNKNSNQGKFAFTWQS